MESYAVELPELRTISPNSKRKPTKSSELIFSNETCEYNSANENKENAVRNQPCGEQKSHERNQKPFGSLFVNGLPRTIGNRNKQFDFKAVIEQRTKSRPQTANSTSSTQHKYSKIASSKETVSPPIPDIQNDLPPSYIFTPKDILLSKVKRQVEFYFSPKNLRNDMYLRKNMDSNGCVPLDLIASFPRIASMTSDSEILLEAIDQSNLLEVLDRHLVRPAADPMIWPLHCDDVEKLSEPSQEVVKPLASVDSQEHTRSCLSSLNPNARVFVPGVPYPTPDVASPVSYQCTTTNPSCVYVPLASQMPVPPYGYVLLPAQNGISGRPIPSIQAAYYLPCNPYLFVPSRISDD